MKPKRLKPRLPEAARDKLHKGSAHKNKKAYNRKPKHSKADDSSSAFPLPMHSEIFRTGIGQFLIPTMR